MALARRVEVVLRLTLKATRKSRAPITVAPRLASNFAGPKSGFHSGCRIFLAQPFVFAGADDGQVAASRVGLGGFVQVDREVELAADAFGELPGVRGRLCHRDAGDRHQGTDVGGAHAGVFAVVLAHVDQFAGACGWRGRRLR